jgi:hypothetical protein
LLYFSISGEWCENCPTPMGVTGFQTRCNRGLVGVEYLHRQDGVDYLNSPTTRGPTAW